MRCPLNIYIYYLFVCRKLLQNRPVYNHYLLLPVSVGQICGYSTAGACGSSCITRLQSDRLARAASPSDRWAGGIAFKLIQVVIDQIQLLMGCY